MSASDPHDYADDADLAEQQTPVSEEPTDEVQGRDDVDEADLLEQATSVPEDDDDDYPG
jgi:hypothetical protein